MIATNLIGRQVTGYYQTRNPEWNADSPHLKPGWLDRRVDGELVAVVAHAGYIAAYYVLANGEGEPVSCGKITVKPRAIETPLRDPRCVADDGTVWP